MSIEPLLAGGLPSDSTQDFDDLKAFNVETLHPARTFIEKLFAVDGLARRLLADPDQVVRGTGARHYYDLSFLADPSGPVLAYLNESDEYPAIVDDCERVSLRWFPDRAGSRPHNGFCNSPAFTDENFASRIAPSFDRAMGDLCYPNAYRPLFGEVVERLQEVKWL